ncbi:MAG: HPF/RaiA family ribosome-associated protein [Candidatus Acidiferrales bacterium]
MKISYSQIEVQVRESIETEFDRHVEKLNRLLSHYDPDLVQLHCTLEKTPRRTEFGFSLQLTLPTGSLQATGRGADARAGAKIAFAEIETQVKKHQQKLRKDYVWKRKRSRGALKPGEVTTAN